MHQICASGRLARKLSLAPKAALQAKVCNGAMHQAVEGQIDDQEKEARHSGLWIATFTHRQALRTLIAANRPLPVRTQRIRLDVPHFPVSWSSDWGQPQMSSGSFRSKFDNKARVRPLGDRRMIQHILAITLSLAKSTT